MVPEHMISHPCTDSTSRHSGEEEREGDKEERKKGRREREHDLGSEYQKNWRGENRDRLNQNTLYAYTKYSIKMEK